MHVLSVSNQPSLLLSSKWTNSQNYPVSLSVTWVRQLLLVSVWRSKRS